MAAGHVLHRMHCAERACRAEVVGRRGQPQKRSQVRGDDQRRRESLASRAGASDDDSDSGGTQDRDDTSRRGDPVRYQVDPVRYQVDPDVESGVPSPRAACQHPPCTDQPERVQPVAQYADLSPGERDLAIARSDSGDAVDLFDVVPRHQQEDRDNGDLCRSAGLQRSGSARLRRPFSSSDSWYGDAAWGCLYSHCIHE